MVGCARGLDGTSERTRTVYGCLLEPVPVPALAAYQLLTASTTPPTGAACFAVGRRCFTAAAMQASYNLGPLYKMKDDGRGVTIAITDSFGNPNMASDLANFNTQMGLPHM